MIPIPKTLLAAMCTLALASAGAVVAAEPDDPKAEPAESHHGGGDPAKMHVPCWSDSDDPDKIFALKMRQHHKMIVEAAQVELEHGDSAELRATAQAAVAFHGAELAKLDAWLMSNAVHPDQLPS